MSTSFPRIGLLSHSARKSAVALVLTFAAGFIDVVGYIAFLQIFSANMTGNTVHIGRALAAGDYAKAVTAAMVVGSFLLGSLTGRVAIEIGVRRHVRTVATFTLAIQAALVVLVASLGYPPAGLHTDATAQLMVALLASAMGLQTATLTRIGPLTVHTTFVTGMLNKLAQLLSQLLFHTYDIACSSSAQHKNDCTIRRRSTIRSTLLIASIWILYLAGASAGTWLELKWNVRALYIPAVVLCLAIAADQKSPLAIEEEKEEMEGARSSG